MRNSIILAEVALCLAAPALLLQARAADGCVPQAPCYSAAGVVNSASGEARFAPFTFITIYGTNLSFETRERRVSDSTPGIGGVEVLIYNIRSLVTYVSPGQVNALIPYSIMPNQDVPVQIVRNANYGPQIFIRISEFAPEFFQDGPDRAVAQHDDWTYIKPDSPARPGGYAILYLTGLGATQIPADDYEAPNRAVRIQARSDLQLLLDGQPVEDNRIEYAGLCPTVPGLYQINLKLPENAGPNPEIRVAIRGELSRGGLSLPVAAK
jgi:uncharacterized protein (TIGR03437 family)